MSGWFLHLSPPEDYIVDYDDEPTIVAHSDTSNNSKFITDMLKATPAKVFRPDLNARRYARRYC